MKTKLRISNCYKTQIVTKLKNFDCNKTQKLELEHKNSTQFDKTQNVQNSTTPIVTTTNN